jgi:transcriptional regulator with XRE-family HTH domain
MASVPKEPIELVLTARFHPRQLGRLLKAVRQAAGITQVELARRLKVPYQNVGRLERGAREGMISTVNRYVRALGWELVIVARPRSAADAAVTSEDDTTADR